MTHGAGSGARSGRLSLVPLTGTIGAELLGAGGDHLDDDAATLLREGLGTHGVVVVRDMDLTPRDLVAVARKLGEPFRVPYVEPVAGVPEVIAVVKEADEHDVASFGGVWHGDFTFLPEPPAVTLLHAVDLPPVGGDTVFADLAAAHDRLPPELRAVCSRLRAVHTARDAYGPSMRPVFDRYASMTIHTSDEADREVDHPLVTVHPETGRKVLFFNPGYVRGFRPLAAADQRRLTALLTARTTDHRLTYRHRWLRGDLVVWDNRATQHIAIGDHPGHRREMIRTTVAGTRPVAAQPEE